MESRSKDNVLIKLFNALQDADLSNVGFGRSNEKFDPYMPHISGTCHQCGKEPVTVAGSPDTEFCSKECLDAYNKGTPKTEGVDPLIGKSFGPGKVDFDAQGVEDPKFKGKVPTQGKVISVEGNTVSIEWEYEDKSKMVEKGVPKEVVEGVVPSNPADKVDDKTIKTLSEEIPGSPIQGDVPAGIPTPATSTQIPVPGSTTKPDTLAFKIIARGISEPGVAKLIKGSDAKREVRPDDKDPKKWMVIVMEDVKPPNKKGDT